MLWRRAVSTVFFTDTGILDGFRSLQFLSLLFSTISTSDCKSLLLNNRLTLLEVNFDNSRLSHIPTLNDTYYYKPFPTLDDTPFPLLRSLMFTGNMGEFFPNFDAFMHLTILSFLDIIVENWLTFTAFNNLTMLTTLVLNVLSVGNLSVSATLLLPSLHSLINLEVLVLTFELLPIYIPVNALLYLHNLLQLSITSYNNQQLPSLITLHYLTKLDFIVSYVPYGALSQFLPLSTTIISRKYSFLQTEPPQRQQTPVCNSRLKAIIADGTMLFAAECTCPSCKCPYSTSAFNVSRALCGDFAYTYANCLNIVGM